MAFMRIKSKQSILCAFTHKLISVKGGTVPLRKIWTTMMNTIRGVLKLLKLGKNWAMWRVALKDRPHLYAKRLAPRKESFPNGFTLLRCVCSEQKVEDLSPLLPFKCNESSVFIRKYIFLNTKYVSSLCPVQCPVYREFQNKWANLVSVLKPRNSTE